MKTTDDIISKLNETATLLRIGNDARDPAEVLAALPEAFGGAEVRLCGYW